MSKIYDLTEIASHLPLRSNPAKRKMYIARMDRFTSAAGLLLDPHISFLSTWPNAVTVSDSTARRRHAPR